MATAILNSWKWDASDKNLEEYKKMGGKFVEGTNEEIEKVPKFTAIFDPEPEKKLKGVKKLGKKLGKKK